MIDTEFSLSSLINFLPLISTISLTIISLIVQEYYLNNLIKFKYSKIGYNIFSFFNLKYLIELLYNKYIVENILKLGGQTVRYLDKGSVELIGPWGIEQGLLKLSKNLSRLDTGVVTSYALYLLIGLTLFMTSSLYLEITDSFIIILMMFIAPLLFKGNSSENKNNKLDYSNSLSLKSNKVPKQ